MSALGMLSEFYVFGISLGKCFMLQGSWPTVRYGRVCRLVKLRISMIRAFSFGNISHITLYAQLEIV